MWLLYKLNTDNSLLNKDIFRYGKNGKAFLPSFQLYFRLAKAAKNPLARAFYRVLFYKTSKKYFVEISLKTEIGPGLYIGHAFGITINPLARIGNNVNIHKGVTIGQENRGVRNGAPTIGNDVWIGINAIIVGKVHIGNDVLIAPNSYVNFDVPDHSIVIGNPGTIIHRDNATHGYINNRV